MSQKYTLYGAPLSLYTGKVRAYLIYKDLDYEEVFSSLRVYKNIIVPKTGVRFIPVVKTPEDEYLQDTAVIIDELESRHPSRAIMPTTPKQRLVSHLFELWADEWLLIPAMHYRWNKDNFPFIYQEFGKIVLPSMPAFIRAFVGKKIGAKFKGFVPILGITEASIPAIEDWYENHVLSMLDAHFAKHQYLLGDAPSLGDFCLMGPLYAHLYRDPEPGRLMREKAPNLARWIERMNSPVTQLGAWLPDDEIPHTLEPILKRLFEEFWPVLANTVDALSTWIENNPDQQDIPRTIGNHAFRMGDVSEQRAIMTFHQWKVQRTLECYNSLPESDKPAVDALLTQLGGKEAMQLQITRPVKRVNNKLRVE